MRKLCILFLYQAKVYQMHNNNCCQQNVLSRERKRQTQKLEIMKLENNISNYTKTKNKIV